MQPITDAIVKMITILAPIAGFYWLIYSIVTDYNKRKIEEAKQKSVGKEALNKSNERIGRLEDTFNEFLHNAMNEFFKPKR